MRYTLSALILLTTLLASAGTPDTASASGVVGISCVPGWEFVLQLRDVPGTKSTYLIYYPAKYPKQKWKPPLHQELEFLGPVYLASGEEVKPWPKAKIVFDSFSDKDATGTYSMKLKDAEVQGSFHVKHGNHGKHAVCM